MPTVLKQDGFNIVIWTHDHMPMHVHCYLGKPNQAPAVELWLADAEVKKNRGLSLKDVRRARKIVEDNRDFLIREWQRIEPLA